MATEWNEENSALLEVRIRIPKSLNDEQTKHCMKVGSLLAANAELMLKDHYLTADVFVVEKLPDEETSSSDNEAKPSHLSLVGGNGVQAAQGIETTAVQS